MHFRVSFFVKCYFSHLIEALEWLWNDIVANRNFPRCRTHLQNVGLSVSVTPHQQININYLLSNVDEQPTNADTQTHIHDRQKPRERERAKEREREKKQIYFLSGGFTLIRTVNFVTSGLKNYLSKDI